MSPTLQASIIELKGSLNKLADEIMHDSRIDEMRKLVITVNALEEFCKLPKTTLSAILKFGEAEGNPEVENSTIRQDEFVGFEALDAAKRYLKKIGKAARFDDIVTAIKKGGGVVANEEKLKVSLARSAWDVIKIGDDLYGLLTFYPHIQRGKKKKGAKGKDELPTATDPDTPESDDEEESDLSLEVPPENMEKNEIE